VVTKMFELASEYSVEHIALAEAADIVVIAPATADIIARIAAGIADDMVCCTVLATKAPIIVAPAMHAAMYQNEVTQDNLDRLKARGFILVGPDYGRLASGGIGLGRLVDVNDIFGTICQVLGKNRDLAGRRIVVTAGGTQEPVDPVRSLTNRSSGKMGYALAEAARDRGATVFMISAPTALHKPVGVDVVNVGTAQEMYETVKKAVVKSDVLIMAAAVADYRPKRVLKNKIKRELASTLTLDLERTPDILGEVKGKFLRVGFAAESENLVANAKEKLDKKRLDLIVANDITAEGSGIGADANQVVIIDRKGKVEKLPLLPKREVADRILNTVAELLGGKYTQVPQELDYKLLQGDITFGRFELRRYLRKFPKFFPPLEEDFDLEIDGTPAKVSIRKSTERLHGRKLKEWFEKHRSELKAGERVIFQRIGINVYRLRKL
jgi:phosphopantothenoylcysteine decarboxylase / phosphopantothenate---cysteine ligase